MALAVLEYPVVGPVERFAETRPTMDEEQEDSCRCRCVPCRSNNHCEMRAWGCNVYNRSD